MQEKLMDRSTEAIHQALCRVIRSFKKVYQVTLRNLLRTISIIIHNLSHDKSRLVLHFQLMFQNLPLHSGPATSAAFNSNVATWPAAQSKQRWLQQTTCDTLNLFKHWPKTKGPCPIDCTTSPFEQLLHMYREQNEKQLLIKQRALHSMRRLSLFVVGSKQQQLVTVIRAGSATPPNKDFIKTGKASGFQQWHRLL